MIASNNAVLTLAVAIISSGALVAVLGRLSEASDRRRRVYAEALSVLVEWIEFPYRIRRRVTDDPVELARLADRGHRIQERLAYYRTWIAAENPALGLRYQAAAERVGEFAGRESRLAWGSPRVSSPEAMNLNDTIPPAPDDVLDDLRKAIANRFGVRRVWTLLKRAGGARSG